MSDRSIRAVLFDMDGVLVDSFEAWFLLMNSAARDLGYPPITRARFHEIWGQGVDLDVKLCFTRHTLTQVEAYYNRHFRDYAEHVRVNPRAGAVFDELKNKGRGIAVITNTPSPIAREVLRHAGLAPDVLIGGTDVPQGKPAPDMVLKALEQLEVSEAEAILVGDSHFDREAAASAGVAFHEYNIQSDDELDAILTAIASTE
jgi:HAD superfamily hydrolase (TIGR01509 family)